jgi:hypothetical protein
MAALAGLASNAAGEATEGSRIEPIARMLGGAVGGGLGGKALGPKALKAAVPTEEQLRTAATAGYHATQKSGLEVDVNPISELASKAAEALAEDGFSADNARQTFSKLGRLAGLADEGYNSVTATGLNAIRRGFQRIASETQPAEGGRVKPTADAAAATRFPYSLGIGVPLYAAKRAAEAMTVNRANKLAQMFAMRSPLYQQNPGMFPAAQMGAAMPAALRALAGGL